MPRKKEIAFSVKLSDGTVCCFTKEQLARWENEKKQKAFSELLNACKYVVAWHREHDSGEGELFGQDFVTTCIAAIRAAEGEIENEK